MLEKIKKCCSLTNILKFVGVLIILLFLGGLVSGFIDIQQAKKEKNAIESINTIIRTEGLTEQAKTKISNFMRTYPNTENIIICDRNGDIVYKANDKMVNGRPRFDISKDEQNSNMYRNKDMQRFMPMPKKELFSLIPSNSSFNRMSEKSNNQINVMGNGRNQMRQGRDQMSQGMKKGFNFINSFNVSNDGMRIHFISGRFHQNKMVNMFFVTHEILRALILLFWLLLAIWVYKDSEARGGQKVLWGLFALLTGFVGFIVYLIANTFSKFCSECKIKVSKEANYCQKCGTVLKTKCDSCEAMMELDWNNCTNCGNHK